MAQSGNDMQKKAKDIHARILTLDTHTDTPMLFFEDSSIDLGKRNNNTKVDFVKMQEGGLDAVFFAVYLEQGLRDDAGHTKAVKKALATFKSIREHVNKYPDKAGIINNPLDAYKLKKEGRKAVFIGVENGYAIGTDLANLSEFKKHGATYMTLSHTKNNNICDSSTDKPEHNGLSDFGVQVVKEMNRLGIIIDVSHTSDKTVRDAIRYSKAPVIASHSNAKALCDIPRNLNDDLIKLIAKTGGVVQVCFVSRFVKPLSLGRATVADLVDHIDYIVRLVGIDYVGIGSDFDGGGNLSGCRDVSQMENITAELLRRGYSERDIEKIWGANFLRVMTDVQKLVE